VKRRFEMNQEFPERTGQKYSINKMYNAWLHRFVAPPLLAKQTYFKATNSFEKVFSCFLYF
jgi:hypothetical protein